MNKKFIVFWDCYGLESCIDITEKIDRGDQFEKESIFERIKDPEKTPVNKYVKEVGTLIHTLQLRAQFNPHRNYELYLITGTSDISDRDIIEWFEASPQIAADRCREIGTKILSHRDTNPDRRVIS